MTPLFAFLLFASPTTAAAFVPASVSHPEAKAYYAARNASADVEAALARARINGKRVVIVLGANWCHDSRALAGWFEMARFKAMLIPRYELVYVDVGQRDRNIHVAQRFGLSKIKGTPTVLIVSANGKLLNKRDAPTWRNAASRSEEAIFQAFETR
jgi:thioredoxin-like negative regulator of GroEL